MARVQDGAEVKSMIDLVLMKNMLFYMQDVRAARGMGRGLSDHLCYGKLGWWVHGLRGGS